LTTTELLHTFHSMQLLTFAHFGEAEAFIQYFNAQKEEASLFSFDQGLILITGEGLFETLSAVSKIIAIKPQIKEILNFGVAGSLKEYIEKESIHEIRHVYSHHHDLQYKSFKSKSQIQKTLDVVSSFKRVLHPEQRSLLSPIAQIVDRELWSIAFVAYENKIPWRSFKFISDLAGTLDSCELTKEMASHASEKLLQKYLELNDVSKEEIIESKLDLYLTFTQKAQLKNIEKRLKIIYGDLAKNIIQDTFTEINLKEITPKQKTKLLLEVLEEKLNPWQKEFNSKIEVFKRDIERQNMKLTIDPEKHTKLFKLSFEFDSQTEFDSMLMYCQTFNFSQIENLLNGES
jgi:hypothetical protein